MIDGKLVEGAEASATHFAVIATPGVRTRLPAGASRIRTPGPTCDGIAVKRRSRAILGGDHDGIGKIQDRAPCGVAMADRGSAPCDGIVGRSRRHALIDSRSKLTMAQVGERLCAEIEREKSGGVQYWALFDHRNGEFVGCGGLRPWLYLQRRVSCEPRSLRALRDRLRPRPANSPRSTPFR